MAEEIRNTQTQKTDLPQEGQQASSPNALYEFRLKQLEEQVDKHQESVVGYAKDVQGIASGYVGDFITGISLVLTLLGFVGWLAGKKIVQEQVKKLFEEQVEKELNKRFRQYDEDIAEIKEEAELGMRLLTMKPEEKIRELQIYLEKLNSKYAVVENDDKKREYYTIKRAEYHFYCGNNFAAMNDYQQAIKEYNISIALHPYLAVVYNNRGNVYLSKGEYDQSIKDFNRAIELNPTDAATYYNRGNAHFNKGEYNQAVKDFERSIKLNPSYASAYHNRGVAYRNEKHNDLAVVDYKKTIELNPNHANAHYNLACLYALEEPRDDQKVFEHLRKAIELDRTCKEEAKTDEDFTSFYNNPDFQKLVGMDE
jgi:tetratricopeptide (TPR) repeat protein